MSAKKIDYMENKQLKNESIYGVGNWFKRYYPDEWFFELILKKVIWNWETICRGCQAVGAIWLLGGPGDNSRPTGEPIPASISARQTSALHLIKFQMAWGPCRYRPTTSQKYIKHSQLKHPLLCSNWIQQHWTFEFGEKHSPSSVWRTPI